MRRNYRITVFLLSVALLGICAGPELAARPAPAAAAAVPATASCGGLASYLVTGLVGALLVAVMWARRALRRLRHDWRAVAGAWAPPRRPGSRGWPS